MTYFASTYSSMPYKRQFEASDVLDYTPSYKFL
jgi:hypothetical protein